MKWRLPAWDVRLHGTICVEEEEYVMDMVGTGEGGWMLYRRCCLIAGAEDAEKVYKKEHLLKEVVTRAPRIRCRC